MGWWNIKRGGKSLTKLKRGIIKNQGTCIPKERVNLILYLMDNWCDL